jgi:hypothetical protein
MTATADEPQGALEDRVETLETGQSRMSAKLDEILGLVSGKAGKVHAAAEQHEEAKLGRPSTIEEQVRAELAKAEQDKAARAEAEQQKSEAQQIREQIAKLTEAKPVQPQPRRQRVMWGKQ